MSKQRIPKSQYVLGAKSIGKKYQLRVDLLNGSAIVPVSLQTGKGIVKFSEHLQRLGNNQTNNGIGKFCLGQTKKRTKGNIYHKEIGVMSPIISTTQVEGCRLRRGFYLLDQTKFHQVMSV